MLLIGKAEKKVRDAGRKQTASETRLHGKSDLRSCSSGGAPFISSSAIRISKFFPCQRSTGRSADAGIEMHEAGHFRCLFRPAPGSSELPKNRLQHQRRKANINEKTARLRDVYTSCDNAGCGRHFSCFRASRRIRHIPWTGQSSVTNQSTSSCSPMSLSRIFLFVKNSIRTG